MPTKPKCFEDAYIVHAIAQELKKSGIKQIDLPLHNAFVRVYLRGAEEMQNIYTEIFENFEKGAKQDDNKN